MAENEEAKAETPEEGVDWQAANDFFNGKPEDAGEKPEGEETPAGEKEDEAKLIEVSIRGRKVLMTEEAAQAHRDYMREVRERDGRLGGEIAQLRERSAKLEGALETIGKTRGQSDDRLTPPPAKLAVEDFEEYHRQMLAYNREEMTRQQADLVARYEQDISARTTQTAEQRSATVWATKFYEKNPELNHPRLRNIVHEVYQEHRNEIDTLGAADGHDLLAELAFSEVASLRNVGKTNNTDTKRPPRLEGAARSGARRATEDRHVPVTAASWVRRERARQRGEKVA